MTYTKVVVFFFPMKSHPIDENKMELMNYQTFGGIGNDRSVKKPMLEKRTKTFGK